MSILAGFKYKYKTLPRSEKRELEFLDAESEIAFFDKIETYQQQKRMNPQYKNITYIGGCHKKTRVNVLGNLKIDGDVLSMYSTYNNKTVFEIPVSEIFAIKYEQIEDESYSGSSFFYINFMYIHYTSDDEKFMLRFKLGRTIKYALENRIKELNANRKPPQVNPPNKIKSEFDISNQINTEKIPAEVQKAIEQKYESIENRLERLKYFMDKDLITEEEYNNRKQEIINEI